jgi:hypothetical protein
LASSGKLVELEPRMAIVHETASEIEIVTDLMDGDRLMLLKLLKLSTGDLVLYLGNPEGGPYGSQMKTTALLSAAEVSRIKAWL